MRFDDLFAEFLPVLPSVPEGGMIYYLQSEALLRGRRHQNTWFCTFNGGEKEVPQFFIDQANEVINMVALVQSIQVQYLGFWFVKLFPPPYVIQFFPYPIFGFQLEPATASKNLATVSFETLQTGRRRWMRKFLFGLPESFVDGEHLTGTGHLAIFTRLSRWEQLWHPDFTEWPYTMGKMNRYIDGSLHSPLNPLNYWPLDRMHIRFPLVKHRHVKRSKRYPFFISP